MCMWTRLDVRVLAAFVSSNNSVAAGLSSDSSCGVLAAGNNGSSPIADIAS